MRLSLKLILSFLIVGLTGVGLVALLASRTTESQFGRFLFDQYRESQVDLLAAYYAEHEGWYGMESLPSGSTGYGSGAPRYRPERGGHPALADAKGVVLLTGLGYYAGDQIPAEQLDEALPISVDGEIVGWLLAQPEGFRQSPEEALFIRQVNSTLLLSALGASVVSLLLGAVLSRALADPVRELTEATSAVARGDLDQRVPVRSSDELGRLAQSFNRMSGELKRARDLRRQMTADIAHELRTPISVILGHVDALDEGVLPPNEETFKILREETSRLERLVDDLRTLSQADAGELSLLPRLVAPEALLQRAAAAHEPLTRSKQITLRLEADPGAPHIRVDPDRMAQVLDNLLANAVRHTPERGEITLLAVGTPEGVEIRIQDTGPGIPEEDRDRVFDRFYRPEPSRSRSSGGSGLGLAIAKSIVQAHGGDIRAERALSSGTVMVVRLPAGGEDSAGGPFDPG